jgi:hypothetical protein
MASNPYNPPPAAHQHTVVIQPVVVRQPAVRSQTDDFFGGLGRALDNTANDFMRATADVSRELVTSNPLDFLKTGYVVQLVSKLCGKSLRVLENGVLDCGGDTGTACQFQVLRTGPNQSAIKLKNVAQPQYYIAVIGGYLVGYGQGGVDCDFYPTVALDQHVILECCMIPGSHVGVLPSGQLTAPAQTAKQTDAAHFKIKYIGTVKR